MEKFAIIERIEEALKHELPGKEAHDKMMPEFPENQIEYFSDSPLRDAAVLICLFLVDNKIHTVLIERTQDAGPHSGQIAFPGGRSEDSDKNIIQTATREAYEEVGIYPEDLKILGCLTPVSIPVSGYSVVPVVAYSTIKPNLIPEKEEVKTIITCNFQKLLASKTEQIINVRDITISVPCYMVKNYIVWGATAMVLSELEAILVSVMR